ncbi:peroxiredoxin [Deinococcus sonorensis]|uniref:thioredoxin-dependent peroxiredoxin n=2 Tax=Deinococcus sonorensis TaxID=309891 RepID=A0AAU7U6P3_9DEIO
MSSSFTVGDLAPDFQMSSRKHQRQRLSDTQGRWTVLYFFPRANHPHCVMQSRRFQTIHEDFEAMGVSLIGVSVDTAEQQKNLSSFCTLAFPLVSDAGHEISRQYGVLASAEVEGETVTYARRETVLIDPAGRVAHHWKDVDPNTHAQQVLEHIGDLLGWPQHR